MGRGCVMIPWTDAVYDFPDDHDASLAAGVIVARAPSPAFDRRALRWLQAQASISR